MFISHLYQFRKRYLKKSIGYIIHGEQLLGCPAPSSTLEAGAVPADEAEGTDTCQRFCLLHGCILITCLKMTKSERNWHSKYNKRSEVAPWRFFQLGRMLRKNQGGIREKGGLEWSPGAQGLRPKPATVRERLLLEMPHNAIDSPW